MKKSLIDKARESGAYQRINELVSAAYLLISEAYLLQQEADEELRKYGLVQQEIKQRTNAMQKEFDKYFRCVASIITDPEQKTNYFHDLDDFNRKFRTYAKLEEQRVQRQ